MEFEPQVTLTEQIADHLGGEIIAGRLAPASRIQELKVAGELGVSRGSVREALLILESRHLIEIIPRRGAVVSSMESNEIADFCEVFTQMQSLCFGKLAGLENPEITALGQALADMGNAVRDDDLDGVLASRKAFLLGSLPPLNNFYLSSVLRGLIPAGLRMERQVYQHPSFDIRDALRYHHALLDAIETGELGRVEELVRAYHGRERKLALGCRESNGVN
ncbi:MAG: GntR family transcriptional regulator [Gammaproteobacteria bacterium]|nr:MAG: GntR family transcriptional regulator [Gammaproteobacteria bacterium]